MATPIRMPQPGQMTEECTMLEWFKHEGEAVSRGDPLFEIETDKSNMEIEAFDAGTLLRIVVTEGQTVPVDTVVAWIGQPGEAIPEGETPAVGVPDRAATAAAAESAASSAPAGPSLTAGDPPAASGLAVGTSSQSASRIGAYPSQPGEYSEGRRIAISPRAKRIAAELGVRPRTVNGTGPGGRIVERDVRGAAEREGVPAGGPDTARRRGVVDPGDSEPLSRIRQVIARRLTESVSTIPHYTVTVVVDMTALMALRAELKASGSRVTVTDYIHAATIGSLVELPLVNSRTDGKSLWTREQVHLGIAVSIPDGLLVPVIRDADQLGLAELHDRSASVVEGARAGSLGPDELSGSTFTVSNMGMFGVEQFSAIINPGESGILAVSSITPEPVVLGDGIAIRQMMRLTLSADHRLVDGELGARFLNAIRARLEEADAWKSAD